MRRKFMDMKYTPGGWRKMIRTGLVLGLAEPTVIAGVRALQAQLLNRKKKIATKGEDGKWKIDVKKAGEAWGEEEVNQFFGGLPGIGGAVRSGMAMVENGPFSPAADSSSFFLDQYLGVAKRLGYDTYQWAKNGAGTKKGMKARNDLLTSLPDMILSLTAGVSYRSISDYAQAILAKKNPTGEE
jgi:hypothetical protein